MTLRSQPYQLIDRSRVVAREECGRLRYLTYDHEGTGVEPDAQALPLISGIAIHAAHARLLLGEGIESIVTDVMGAYRSELTLRGLQGIDVTEDLTREQSALLEGMLRMWQLKRLPMLLEDYEVVTVERGWQWPLAAGLRQSLRMDAVLRRRDDGLLHILDYKSCSYPSDVWADKFEHDHQTLLYVQALEEATQEPIAGILFEGLVKGLFRKDTAMSSPFYGRKIQQSPYTLAYMASADGLDMFQTAYTAKKAFTRVRPYDHMPVKDWVQYLIDNEPATVESLFVAVPPICPPRWERVELKEQVIREELAYFDQLDRYRAMPEGPSKEAFLDILAPKRRQRCFKYGVDNRCVFATDVCFNQGAKPLEIGGFRPRTPHHDTEVRVIL